MAIVLSGDIGGTKTILRLSDGGSSPTAPGNNLFQKRYVSNEYSDLAPMVQQFLQAAKEDLSPELSVQLEAIPAACFAIAGPVVDNGSKLTNLSWTLEGARLATQLGIPKIELINDFAAIGYGVTVLLPTDLKCLQDAPKEMHGPIAVLGAGTGLGQTYCAWDGDEYRVYGSEGGHTGFAPNSELQLELLEFLFARHGRVSIERVVSGQGIVAIYQFLRDRGEILESEAVGSVVKQWEETGEGDPGAAIGGAAVAGADKLAIATIELFVEAYGMEAGDLALKLLPQGGLFIAGGIAPKLLSFLEKDIFIKAFLDKGRLRSLLEKIPVNVVLNPEVGSIGAALHAIQLQKAAS